MPFTGSHPAVVLPLLRTPLPASALVLGSTAPDLPHFLPGPFPWPTHSALAVAAGGPLARDTHDGNSAEPPFDVEV